MESQSQENRTSHLHCCDYISPANAISFSFKKRINQKSHNRSIRLIYTMRFSCDCDCDSKSLRLIRTSSNYSPRFRNRKYMRFPHLHYAIFWRLRLRFQIAIARKSHSVNGAIRMYRSSPLVPLDSCLTAAACLFSAC